MGECLFPSTSLVEDLTSQCMTIPPTMYGVGKVQHNAIVQTTLSAHLPHFPINMKQVFEWTVDLGIHLCISLTVTAVTSETQFIVGSRCSCRRHGIFDASKSGCSTRHRVKLKSRAEVINSTVRSTVSTVSYRQCKQVQVCEAVVELLV